MAPLNFDESDEMISEKLTELTRIEQYTLSFFLTQLWVDTMGAIIIFLIFYFCCRVHRRDKERFV